MNTILKQIIKQIWTDEKKKFDSFHPDSFRLLARKPPLDVLPLMEKDFFFIAEVKKASPSKGIIKEGLDVIGLAGDYEKAGAGAVSVVTEKNYFLGSKEDLKAVKINVEIPVLRKDFIIHPYQIYESYNLGADFILMIAACLDEETLRKMYAEALNLNLRVLLEVHNEEELFRVLQLNPDMIGINNRNLETFEVDRKTSLKLKKLIPESIQVISESGIHASSHVRELKDAGFSGVLVGEVLCSSPFPGETLRELLNA
ncbi:MAG: indole-3-glycerol phosphate synthase TrpC [Candidatus Aminicenantes bacterium]|nr:indole-3-glycerol phosphate synthase TrpC [Candidatus Aminicenantes bacterium]